jgi:hypothetical protein
LRKKEVKAKGTGNIFNKVVARNPPKSWKEMPTQAQYAFRTPNRKTKI